MRVALIHDYLREYGGAERVVEALHEMWPDAPLYTSFIDWKTLGNHADRFRGWDIRTSWVQRNPIVKKFHSPLRFLAPKIWESFDLSEYDLVISSSGWFISRGVRVGRAEVGVPWFSPRQGPDLQDVHKPYSAKAVTGLETARLPAHRKTPLHICYIHHPPRNLYGYATGSLLQRYWPVRAYAAIINFFLRHYDFTTAQRVDYFVANSKETARRVWKFYRRESTVIYPPIETNHKSQIPMTKQTPNSKSQLKQRGSYYLTVGRMTYSKRVDLAIEAANRLKVPLKVVGTGSEEERLRSIAGPTVEFLGSVSDEELGELYSGAKALVFCALDEDFGMVPVEAMAHGTPVIALAQGGVVESVVDGLTGILFHEPEVEDLVRAIGRFNSTKRKWESACRAQAENFSKERFKRELSTFVQLKLQKS
jgi:glycosyltransferase involved in cell wall biosynthesis